MSKHDIERAKARRAPEVAAKRSTRKANAKRATTVALKTAAAAGTVAVGTYAVNKYLKNHDVRLNGNPIRIKPTTFTNAAEWIRRGKNFFNYMY